MEQPEPGVRRSRRRRTRGMSPSIASDFDRRQVRIFRRDAHAPNTVSRNDRIAWSCVRQRCTKRIPTTSSDFGGTGSAPFDQIGLDRHGRRRGVRMPRRHPPPLCTRFMWLIQHGAQMAAAASDHVAANFLVPLSAAQIVPGIRCAPGHPTRCSVGCSVGSIYPYGNHRTWILVSVSFECVAARMPRFFCPRAAAVPARPARPDPLPRAPVFVSIYHKEADHGERGRV